MKKIKKLLNTMLAIALTATPFSSCSEEKDEPQTPAAETIAGVYSGNMDCTVMGSTETFENVTFTVTKETDSSVSVIIPSFGESPMQVPSLTISNVKVSGSDGAYTLSETSYSGTTDEGKTYSGTLAGTFANNTINIQFNLQYGAMPMPMICNFSASKK